MYDPDPEPQQIGYLINSRTVMCQPCKNDPTVGSDLDIRGIPARLYLVNVGQYNQHCHFCYMALHIGVFGVELFQIGPVEPLATGLKLSKW